MLGARSRQVTGGIAWAAFGKHPAWAEFFAVGSAGPCALAYQAWVRRGFDHLLEAGHDGRRPCVYHLWSAGENETILLFGLLRASADALGRPFPLLLTGTMAWPGWQSAWQRLDDFFVGMWPEVEDAARGMHAAPADILARLAAVSLPTDMATPRRPGDNTRPAPTAMFTGGCGEEQAERRFYAPLTADDFVRLWTQ
ncbi:MAG: hypothetical protein BWK76_01200 [Desulfobulbaceae bacterium A2]|nr:MAG: hypothetical protein BWK76_01200 [Desulfobulbaceae bacterium A2]